MLCIAYLPAGLRGLSVAKDDQARKGDAAVSPGVTQGAFIVATQLSMASRTSSAVFRAPIFSMIWRRCTSTVR